MNKEKTDLYLGIDIGGSSVKYGWGSLELGLMHFERIRLSDISKSALLKIIDEVLHQANSHIGIDSINAIGVGTPGTLNRKSGKIVGFNPNLQDWVDLNPRVAFPDSLWDKIVVDNDANLMALAESYQLPRAKYVLGITLGSGIGCGFVIDNQVYYGANGYAMELGHNIVIVNGAECNCGKKGCLEAYASANGMHKLVGELNNLHDPITNITDLLELASSNHQIESIINRAIDCLTNAISNLAINLDADAIIIGGGLIEIREYPTQKLIDGIYSSLPTIAKDSIIVKKAVFGNKAGVMGAILLAENCFT